MVPIVDEGGQKNFPAMVKVGLSRFQKPIEGIGKRLPETELKMSGKFVQSGFDK